MKINQEERERVYTCVSLVRVLLRSRIRWKKGVSIERDRFRSRPRSSAGRSKPKPLTGLFHPRRPVKNTECMDRMFEQSAVN